MPATETSHFWLGRFESEERVGAYFAEVYDEDEGEDGEETPISRFARDLGETWYDHDFLEYNFGEAHASIEALVQDCSYQEQWAAELARRASIAGIGEANTVVFISKDQIEDARSIEGDGYRLVYLGTIRYRI